jgi:hypothetical protein
MVYNLERKMTRVSACLNKAGNQTAVQAKESDAAVVVRLCTDGQEFGMRTDALMRARRVMIVFVCGASMLLRSLFISPSATPPCLCSIHTHS